MPVDWNAYAEGLTKGVKTEYEYGYAKGYIEGLWMADFLKVDGYLGALAKLEEVYSQSREGAK